MESYLVFCLNFVIFEAFFSIVFRIDFWTHFLSKNRSKMTPKDVTCAPLKSTFFEVGICYCIFVDFGLTFGAPLASFGHMLGSFWLKLVPFWCHVGPNFGYFAPSGVSFWLVLGEIQFLRQKFVKKHSCIDPGIKFLANFRMQTIFPRPGGGAIAAGNRDSPQGR